MIFDCIAVLARIKGETAEYEKIDRVNETVLANKKSELVGKYKIKVNII